eukprot:scaffold626_cov337-Pavlova_lutheri.AAC.65
MNLDNTTSGRFLPCNALPRTEGTPTAVAGTSRNSAYTYKRSPLRATSTFRIGKDPARKGQERLASAFLHHQIASP